MCVDAPSIATRITNEAREYKGRPQICGGAALASLAWALGRRRLRSATRRYEGVGLATCVLAARVLAASVGLARLLTAILSVLLTVCRGAVFLIPSEQNEPASHDGMPALWCDTLGTAQDIVADSHAPRATSGVGDPRANAVAGVDHLDDGQHGEDDKAACGDAAEASTKAICEAEAGTLDQLLEEVGSDTDGDQRAHKDHEDSEVERQVGLDEGVEPARGDHSEIATKGDRGEVCDQQNCDTTQLPNQATKEAQHKEDQEDR